MADFMRLHVEHLIQIADDVALENVDTELDREQDDDTLSINSGLRRITLDAGAAATEVPLPTGASAINFLAVADVDSSSGVNLHLGGSGNDPVLVKPPSASGKKGHMSGWISASSLHVSNPSATDAVSFRVLMACS